MKKVLAIILTLTTILSSISFGVSAETVPSNSLTDGTFQTVGTKIKGTKFGNASCSSTSACFGSVYYRVLKDDHGYYKGAASIENYLKNVFVKDSEGAITVNSSSSLGRISYTNAMTIINFASAFSSYEEYIIRNGKTLSAELEEQKSFAIKYFNTVNTKVEGYHTHTGTGLTFPSMAVAVVAMGSLMEQYNTDRYDALIKEAYENVDNAFYNSMMYLKPFYQLCSKYDWFDATDYSLKVKPDDDELLTALTVKDYYAYGTNLEKDYPDQWETYKNSVLEAETLTPADAQAFAYHYAYQITDGDVYLGIYGSSRDIVDFDDEMTQTVAAVKAAINALPDVSDITLDNKAEVEAARTVYEALTEKQKNYVPTTTLTILAAAEAKIKELSATPDHKHSYGSWETVSNATVFQAEQQKRTCTCGDVETRTVGSKLAPVLEVQGKLKSIPVKAGKTITIKLSLENGDSLDSVKVSNSKYAKLISLNKKNGTIKLKSLKKGSTTLKIRLASKKTRSYKVKVTNGTVKTTKLTAKQNKITLKKGNTVTLKSVRVPFTSTEKVIYKSSNKKVAVVTSSGKVKAVGAGTVKITMKSGTKKATVNVIVPKRK